MPYRNGLIQTAAGALMAVIFVVSNCFSSPDGKQKRVVGTIRQCDGKKLWVKADDGRDQELEVADTTVIYLNDRRIEQLTCSHEGRRGSVKYEKKGRTLLAKEVNLYPTHQDFEKVKTEHTSIEQSPEDV